MKPYKKRSISPAARALWRDWLTKTSIHKAGSTRSKRKTFGPGSTSPEVRRLTTAQLSLGRLVLPARVCAPRHTRRGFLVPPCRAHRFPPPSRNRGFPGRAICRGLFTGGIKNARPRGEAQIGQGDVKNGDLMTANIVTRVTQNQALPGGCNAPELRRCRSADIRYPRSSPEHSPGLRAGCFLRGGA